MSLILQYLRSNNPGATPSRPAYITRLRLVVGGTGGWTGIQIQPNSHHAVVAHRAPGQTIDISAFDGEQVMLALPQFGEFWVPLLECFEKLQKL